MGSRIKTASLTALCIAGVYLAGCFPEDSVEWSADGSTGICRVEEALYLVDGQSGELTRIEADGVGMMPGISRDGRLIVYVRDIECENLEEELQHFPEAVVHDIKERARQLKERIMAGHESLSSDALDLGSAEYYGGWIIRYMCENADALLRERIGQQKFEESRAHEIHYSKLILRRQDNLAQGRLVVAIPRKIFRPRFSPEGRHIAYLVPTPQDDETGTLLVASADGKLGAMEVARGVALGYDWRPDSKALAYVKQDGDPILGALEEKVVIDDDGVPLAEPVDAAAEGPVGTSQTTRPGRRFVGTLFHPAIHVAYGLGGRIVLSSAAAAIPTAELDEPKISLFCYDRVTGTVTDILPGVLRNQASQNMNFFRLSPDGKRLLVPLQYNHFAIYELGSNEAIFPCQGDEGFGMDEIPDFVPSWKGNDQITALVPEKSHFLVGSDEKPARRKEIVVIDAKGQLRSVLSRDWPDDAVPRDLQDEADSASERGLSQAMNDLLGDGGS